MTLDLHLGDCKDVFRDVRMMDAVILDPPGGASVMQAAFDTFEHRDAFIAYLRDRLAVCRARTKPGGRLICWAFPRLVGWTHRAIEDAGWIVEGAVQHLHGEGMPHAGKKATRPAHEPWILARNEGPILDLGIDDCRVPRNWAERGEAWMRSGHNAKPGEEKIGGAPPGNGIPCHPGGGWPTDVVLSHCEGCECVGTRKVAGNICSGTGFMGYGGSAERAPAIDNASADGTETVLAWECVAGCDCGASVLHPAGGAPPQCGDCGGDMWWACAVAEIDHQSGERPSGARAAGVRKGIGYGSTAKGGDGGPAIGASTGGAARFYPQFRYYSKASTSERDLGCEHMLWARDKKKPFGWRRVDRAEWEKLPKDRAAARAADLRTWRGSGNVHPTVKSIEHLRFYVRLLCPPGGHVGDGFGGTMTTAIAAALEGRDCTICDVSAEAVEIGFNRLQHWHPMGLTVHGWEPPAYDYWVPPEEPRPERERKQRIKAATPGQVDMFGRREWTPT